MMQTLSILQNVNYISSLSENGVKGMNDDVEKSELD
jgi:hypothetical protein